MTETKRRAGRPAKPKTEDKAAGSLTPPPALQDPADVVIKYVDENVDDIKDLMPRRYGRPHEDFNDRPGRDPDETFRDDMDPPPGGIGALADMFAATGWFNYSAAELATLILVGQDMNLSPVRAAFELEVVIEDAGPRVKWRRDASNFDELAGRHPDKANKRPVLIEKTENGEGPGPDPETLTGDKRGGKAEGFIEPGGAGGSFEAPPGGGGGGSYTLGPAKTDATPADNAAEGDKGPEPIFEPDRETLVLTWRTSIGNICDELGINKNEKLSTFDAARDDKERFKIFETAQSYYIRKTAEFRDLVVGSLNERIAGDVNAEYDVARYETFSIFAEVPADPVAWSYTEARKAAEVLPGFLSE